MIVRETPCPVKLSRPQMLFFFNKDKKVLEVALEPLIVGDKCARDIVRSHWHIAPKKKWTAASVQYADSVRQMTSLVTTRTDGIQHLHLTNSNSFSSLNWNIDTSGNLTDIETALGATVAATHKIYIYNGATLIFNASRSLLQIILGHTSSGAAGAGNRYGLVTGTGVTITWDGNATYTNSGILMNPTSADASSKGCKATFSGCTFTNSVGANNASNRWTINNVYGGSDFTTCNFNYSYQAVFVSICCDSARSNYTPVVRGCTVGAVGAGNHIFLGIGATNLINVYCDFRFNTQIGAGAVNVYFLYSASNIAINSGAVIDFSGHKFEQGTSSIFIFIFNSNTTYYNGHDRITYADTRQTQVVPTSLAFTDSAKGGQVTFTIANAASYADTDEIFIYNASGDTFMGCVKISKYNADGLGRISGLTDGQSYTFYAKATSDGFNFSDATANASPVTPTNDKPAPSIGGNISRRR